MATDGATAGGTPVGAAALAVIAVTAGCCGNKEPLLRPDPRFRVERTPGDIRWRSLPVALVADNQEFYFGGQPFLFRSGFANNHFSVSAVRVPQQDAFGESLLGLALAQSRHTITLHLGDALDLSCAAEWRRFLLTMTRPDETPVDWFFTPGNHDGYFFGNFVEPTSMWRKACEGDRPITKAEIVDGYLDVLAARYGLDLPGAVGGIREGEWTRPAGVTFPLKRVAWLVDPERFWRSYIVQEIDVTVPGRAPASIVLVDTSTYDRPPRITATERRLRRAAGEHGGLGDDQRAAVRAWLRDAHGQGAIVAAMGHHPFGVLDAASRRDLVAAIDDHELATYVSAHTHRGKYFLNPGPQGLWIEPNLGSILDHSAEYGSFRMGTEGPDVAVQLDRIAMWEFGDGTVGADLEIRCQQTGWRAAPDDPDFYTRYRASTSVFPGPIERLYYDTLLAALSRYWRCIPSAGQVVAPSPDAYLPCAPTSEQDAAITAARAAGDTVAMAALVRTLLAADDARQPYSELRRREYKVCQSLWAAEYERRGALAPSPTEGYFIVGGS